jgi:hypothetical protein
VTGSFKHTPDPVLVTETKTRTRKYLAILADMMWLTALAVENAPNGFPRLAAFQASDPNFGLYRSYSYLHSRILLDYQSEITELEEELDQCDWDEVDEDEDRPRFRAPEGAEGVRDRRAILRDIKSKLMEYGMNCWMCTVRSGLTSPQTKSSSMSEGLRHSSGHPSETTAAYGATTTTPSPSWTERWNLSAAKKTLYLSALVGNVQLSMVASRPSLVRWTVP